VFQACRPATTCQQAEPAEDDGQEDGEDQKTILYVAGNCLRE